MPREAGRTELNESDWFVLLSRFRLFEGNMYFNDLSN